MSSCISIKDHSIWVSNARLSTLIAFASDVGESIAKSDEDAAFITSLRRFSAAAFPGIDLDLAVQFPSIAERKWWARVFDTVATRIYLRQLGDQSDQTWQPAAIGEAFAIARMLTRAVQEVELGWHPES
jgi:hypothetical protein